jgi:hypothetical protein
MGLREKILAADDIRREAVEVPEWGVTVHVQTFSAADMVAVGDASERLVDASFNVVLVMLGARDETGARIFTEDDVPALSAKASDPVGKVAAAIKRVSAIGQAGAEAEKKA